MSRNKKFIINTVIIVLVIVLLAAGIYFLSRPEDAPRPDEIDTVGSRIEIFSVEEGDITSASVTNEYGSYSLRRSGSGWSIDGFSGISLNAAMLDNLTGAFARVTSSQLIDESPADLSVYGLDAPSASVDVRTDDGGKIFYVGSKTPDGSSYYFNTNSSPCVYLLDSYVADVAFLTARDYANLGSSFTAEDVTEIRIAPSAGEALHVVMDEGGPRDQYSLLSYWDITEPSAASASNTSVSETLCTPAAALETGASAIIADTVEARAEYGLASPEFTLDVTAGEKITYRISPAAGEYRYILREGSGCILRVDNDDCAFLYTKPYDIMEKYLALIDISLLNSAEISRGGETMVLSVKNPSAENAEFFINGKKAEEDSFRKCYQQIVALGVSGEAVNPPKENIAGQIVYNLASGEKITLEFAEYDDRNYSVFVNGKGQYTILKKNIDKIFDMIKEF